MGFSPVNPLGVLPAQISVPLLHTLPQIHSPGFLSEAKYLPNIKSDLASAFPNLLSPHTHTAAQKQGKTGSATDEGRRGQVECGPCDRPQGAGREVG